MCLFHFSARERVSYDINKRNNLQGDCYNLPSFNEIGEYKVFDLKDRQTGVNYPPMHPNCRSKTRAYMGAEIEATLKRRARNPITNENEIIGNMSYKEWYNAKVKTYGQADIDKAYKMATYRSADIKQYDSYKSRLTDNPHLPSNIDKFLDIKYNNTTLYQELTEHYRYKGRVPEATVNDFKTAKAIKEMGVKGTVRVPPHPPQRAYILEDKAVKRDPAHIMKRMFERQITDDEVQSYVDNALFSITRHKGTRITFFSKEGVTALTKTNDYEGINWIAKTTWNKTDFDENTEKMIKEALRNGKGTNAV